MFRSCTTGMVDSPISANPPVPESRRVGVAVGIEPEDADGDDHKGPARQQGHGRQAALAPPRAPAHPQPAERQARRAGRPAPTGPATRRRCRQPRHQQQGARRQRTRPGPRCARSPAPSRRERPPQPQMPPLSTLRDFGPSDLGLRTSPASKARGRLPGLLAQGQPDRQHAPRPCWRRGR